MDTTRNQSPWHLFSISLQGSTRRNCVRPQGLSVSLSNQGTNMMLSIWCVQRDPTVFEAADTFNPDRWNQPEGEALKKMQDWPRSLNGWVLAGDNKHVGDTSRPQRWSSGERGRAATVVSDEIAWWERAVCMSGRNPFFALLAQSTVGKSDVCCAVRHS